MFISQCSAAFQMKNAELLHSVWIDLGDHGEEPELPSISPGLQDNKCVVRIPQDSTDFVIEEHHTVLWNILWIGIL